MKKLAQVIVDLANANEINDLGYIELSKSFNDGADAVVRKARNLANNYQISGNAWLAIREAARSLVTTEAV